MSKKLVIAIGGVSILLVALALTVVLVEPIRNGLIATIKGTTQDTIDVVTNPNQDPNPSPTEEAGVNDLSEEPIEPTDELGKDTGVAKDLEEMKNAQEHFRPDDKLQIYVPDTTGNAVIFKSGKDTLLVDGGITADLPKVHATLDALGVTKLKYIVISNWHLETQQGVVETLKKYPADYIILAGNLLDGDNGKTLIGYLESNRLIWTIPSNTGTLNLGSAGVKFLSSNKGGSLLTFVNYGQTNIAVSGTTQYFEETIAKYLPSSLDLHILTMSNAEYSVPIDLINKVNPTKIILNNLENVDDKATVEALTRPDSELIRTSETGNLAIGSNGVDLNVILNVK